MSVILITANFEFRNSSSCSKGPIKRAGKVCEDSQDLKSPGFNTVAEMVVEILPGCVMNFIWIVDRREEDGR